MLLALPRKPSKDFSSSEFRKSPGLPLLCLDVEIAGPRSVCLSLFLSLFLSMYSFEVGQNRGVSKEVPELSMVATIALELPEGISESPTKDSSHCKEPSFLTSQKSLTSMYM